MSDPILSSFAHLAARHGARPLVASPRRAASVAAVDSAAVALAAGVRAAGWEAGRVVGLAVANGPAFLAGYVALRRCGAVPVLLDATLPGPARLSAVATLGGAGLLAAPSGWALDPGDWQLQEVAGAEPPALSATTGAVKMTSGSTGSPRGIAVGAEALAADDEQLTAAMGLGPTDRMVAMVPLSHSYGFASLALPALMRGALLLVAEERGPLAPLTLATAGEATFLPTVPAFLAALVRLAEPPPLPPSLRLVISAGAPLPAEVAAAFRQRFGQPAHVFYGASECGGIAWDPEGGAAERGTVGVPFPGVRVELDGESGRLAVRSSAVAAGYLPEPGDELAGGRFLSGDLAEWRAGELSLLGRADDLVTIKGKKINPREVEEVLRQLPGIEDVAVVGLPARRGGGTVLRAVVAAAEGVVDHARLAAYCRDHLPAHKVPRSLVRVRELPRTSRGKLDRAALARLEG